MKNVGINLERRKEKCSNQMKITRKDQSSRKQKNVSENFRKHTSVDRKRFWAKSSGFRRL
jgi:hypothetical protein